MAYTKTKLFSTTTPRGVFRFPALTKPDYGTDAFPKPDGEYKVTLILSQTEAEPLLAQLQPIYDAALEAGRAEFAGLKIEARKKLKDITEQPFFSLEYDKETEEPTGNLLFSFKMKASGTRKDKTRWSRKPAIFDAKGKPLLKTPDIWGGSEGKIAFEVSPYFIPGTALTGIKLQLTAVQLLELRSGSQRDAGQFGFGAEAGYEASDEDEGMDDTPFKDEGGDGDQDF